MALKVEIYVNENVCCSNSSCCPSKSEILVKDLKTCFENKIKVKRINIFESDISVPKDVAKILQLHKLNALPIVLVDRKPAYIGKLPSLAGLVKLLKNQQLDDTNNMLHEVTPTEMLWHKNLSSYSLSSAQCCSTTYFCACASS